MVEQFRPPGIRPHRTGRETPRLIRTHYRPGRRSDSELPVSQQTRLAEPRAETHGIGQDGIVLGRFVV